MKTVLCPSCGKSFDVSEESVRGRGTVPCPGCGSVVVLPRGTGPAASSGEPDTNAYLEPASPGEVPTALGAVRALLSMPASKRVAIVILSGDRKSDVVVVDQASVVIGRQGGAADIQVPDPDVSGRHAAIDCHGERVVIRDLESRNGTFVGEQRVESAALENETEFRVGSTRCMLLLTPLD